MAEQKKMVEEITSMDVDFAKWYTDVVKKAELVEYTSVKGCMVIRPYGYAIWENIQKTLDGMFIMVTIIPAISLALAAIPMFFNDYTGKKKENIQKELTERREKSNVN